MNRLSISPYGHVPAYSYKTSTLLISFSSICWFWHGAREYLCSLLSLRIFLILPSISLLMCVTMSTTSAVTPTLLHLSSTQTCSLQTHNQIPLPLTHPSDHTLVRNQNPIKPELVSVVQMKSNPSVLSDVRMQRLIIRNVFVSVSSLPRSLDF